MRVGKRFLVAGRVQGVGFRYFTRDAARREGIHGTVQNLEDGRVEIVAAGETEAMTRFERAVRRGTDPGDGGIRGQHRAAVRRLIQPSA